jgi:hypothetical protein
MKLICCLLLALAVGAPATARAAAHDANLALIYFSNTCGFSSPKWHIEKDLPAFLTGHVVENQAKFVPFDRVREVLEKRKGKAKELAERKEAEPLQEIGRELGATYLVLGDITRFKIEKKTAVMPDVGGYKQYIAEVEIKLWFFDCEVGDVTFETTLKKELARRGLKFNPPGRISQDEDEYLRLEKEPFGSEVFMHTVIGEALLLLSQEFETKAQAFINYGSDTPPAAAPAPALLSEARILQVDGTDAFINAGKDDQIRNGDQFDVYTLGEAIIDSASGQKLGYREEKVGRIKVAQVKASHFSRVKILEGAGVIKVMDIVRLR